MPKTKRSPRFHPAGMKLLMSSEVVEVFLILITEVTLRGKVRPFNQLPFKTFIGLPMGIFII